MDQFVTRFLLRETVSQLQALQSSLEGASDTLEAQAQAQAQAPAPGPWYVRSLLPCGSGSCIPITYTPGPLAFLTLRSFHRLESNSCAGAGRPKSGRDWRALKLGPQCPQKPVLPCPGLAVFWGPVLGPEGLRQWTESARPLGQMTRAWRCPTGPTAAGGRGAGPCGASGGHPPGLPASLTQVCLWWVGALAEEGQGRPPSARSGTAPRFSPRALPA